MEVNTSWFQFALNVQQRGSNGDLEKVFLVAWEMWYWRNQLIHEEVVISALQAVEMALSSKNTHLQALASQGPRNACRWEAPDPGILKLNVDGVVFANQRSAGVGFILRNSKAEVIFSASKKENDINDPIEIELLAILRGLQFCIPLGISHLVIESDSILMVNEVQSDSLSRSLHGNLVQQIKQVMLRFPSCSIQHNSHLGNGAAHGLANFAWNIDDLITW
ncbi:uncharacterized protein LOC121253432 [Juglans microcarpa x Juglans regia]|uniref:uncharacterized protein LOC121253432 n=1 Tax=Juglans microcarpa x Juglans regia TaxID=2249226 RepID=UPI001B7E1DA3|nr:uncharacterized protein LOC121253432 [Juglans microcarpa x Juglans regia]